MAINREIYQPTEVSVKDLVRGLFSGQCYAPAEQARELSQAGWISLKKELLPPDSRTPNIKWATIMRKAVIEAVDSNPSLIPALMELPFGYIRCNSQDIGTDCLVEPRIIAPIVQEYLISLNEPKETLGRKKEKREPVNQVSITNRVQEILNLSPESQRQIDSILFTGQMEAGETIQDFFARNGIAVAPAAEKNEEDDPFNTDNSVENALLLLHKQEANLPLLTREQEVLLGALVWLGRNVDPLAKPTLWEKLEPKLKPAKDWLVLANTRLVYSIANRYEKRARLGKKYPTLFLDLIQTAYAEGLIKATEKFDFRRGLKFSTYASWWIKEACINYLVKEGLIEPDQNQVSPLAFAKISQRKKTLSQNQVTLSLDEPVNSQKPNSPLLEEQIPDPDADPERTVIQVLLARDIQGILGTLPARERAYLLSRFGLTGYPPLTQSELGHQFGFSRTRAGQIEKLALDHLRQAGGIEELKDWY
jgi:RNA polymerase primary sigma factor